MQLGYNSVLVTGRIDVRNGLGAEDVETMLKRLGEDIKRAVPSVRNIYLEPRAGGSRTQPGGRAD